MSKATLQTLALASVTFGAKFQPRQELNATAVEDYKAIAKEAFEKGADWPLPPLKAVKRGDEYIAIAGFHRRPAAKAAGYEELPFEVIEANGYTDEQIFALAVKDNAEHGVRYTNEDKIHNVQRAFGFPGAEELSNVQIAEIAGVSESFVRKHRPAAKSATVRKGKGGKAVNVANIGKKGGKAEKPKKGKVKGAAPAAGEKPEAPKEDVELGRALSRLSTLFKDTIPNLRESIESNVLPLTPKEIKDWAQTSDARIKRIAPLIIEKRFSPKKALAILDTEPTAKDKIETLLLCAIGNKGKCTVTVEGFSIRVEKLDEEQPGK